MCYAYPNAKSTGHDFLSHNSLADQGDRTIHCTYENKHAAKEYPGGVKLHLIWVQNILFSWSL